MFERLLFKQEKFGFGTPVVEEKVTGRFLGLCGLGCRPIQNRCPSTPVWRLDGV